MKSWLLWAVHACRFAAILALPASVAAQQFNALQSPHGSTFPPGAQQLKPEELKQRVADKSFEYKVIGGGVQFKGEYFTALSGTGFTVSGKYTVDGSTVCFGVRYGCSEYRVVGDALFVKRVSDGQVVELEPK